MQANGHQTLITNYMYAGLLPFFAGALGPWIFADSEVLLTGLFLFYASLILVFLAGVFWAIALFTQIPNHHRHFHFRSWTTTKTVCSPGPSTTPFGATRPLASTSDSPLG